MRQPILTLADTQRFLGLIDIQARMALRADASRLFLGYAWWLLEPLLYVAVFYFVFAVILENPRSDFLVFLICGKLPFMWFSASVNASANSIVVAHGLIGQSKLPKAIFPLAKVQEGMYRQSTVFALLLIAVAFFGYSPSWSWFWLLPIILVEYLLILPCAVGAAVLVCVAKDFARVVQLGTLFLLFISGIFWDLRSIASDSARDALLTLNPMAFLLDSYREVLMYGGTPDKIHLLVLGGICLALMALVLYLVSKMEQWLSLRVLSL